jgi:hypothetical protein
MAGISVSVTIKGLKLVKSNFTKALNHTQRALAGALYLEGQSIMNESEKICPVGSAAKYGGGKGYKGGRLRNSRYVTNPFWIRKSINVRLGYSAYYAAYVHSMGDRHSNIQWTRPGSGDKFLSKPMFAAIPGAARRVAGRQKKLFLSKRGSTILFGNPTQKVTR